MSRSKVGRAIILQALGSLETNDAQQALSIVLGGRHAEAEILQTARTSAARGDARVRARKQAESARGLVRRIRDRHLARGDGGSKAGDRRVTQPITRDDREAWIAAAERDLAATRSRVNVVPAGGGHVGDHDRLPGASP